ncbi:MAG: protein translocase subunit SecF [Acidobacteria bacterium]|nr:protein translocase subunit SecF [Acidobacteriota bacterium]MYJ06151.1 protein translocase subunit SecF [Acidobacteriota bacterium]
MPLLKVPHIDFVRLRWAAFALSAVVIAVGAAVAVARGGLPLGIDFSGGSLLVLQFEQPTGEGAVRDALASIEEKVVQQYGVPGDNQVLVRLPISGPESGASLEEGANAVAAELRASPLGEFQVISQELVGPIIGEELQRRGVNAFVFAMAGILVYIGLRFRFSFAVGAVVAVAHDIAITLAMLAVFDYELSLNVVAAMLTITGYSVNDSIVVFDRVRENLRVMRRDAFPHLVNTSINQTLVRTIITSGTTGGAVLALYVLGGEVLRGFAFTMLVGVVSGTYSTIFVASIIAIAITERRAARARQAGATPAAQGAPAASPTRSSRRRRKARAS